MGPVVTRSLAVGLRPLSVLVRRQYHVDELYRWALVRGTRALARLAAWVDEAIIDGIVNAVAPLVSGLAAGTVEVEERGIDLGVMLVSATPVVVGRRLRRLHTGLLQTYAVVLFGAAVVGLVLMLIWS
ncbi:MAG: hypothetical protein GX496_00165 [Firmicutes bacterium]|nr:hypothetical protein [Bacillota bacterium]